MKQKYFVKNPLSVKLNAVVNSEGLRDNFCKRIELSKKE